jgi:hypothetical protein
LNGQTHGGKGSAQRQTDQKKFAANWDAIYGSNKKEVKKDSKNSK